MRSVTDEQLQRFWTRYDNLSRSEQAQQTEPVMRRLGPMLTPEFRGIFGESEGVDMAAVLAEGKILIVNLAEGLGEGPAALLGALVVARLWQELERRSRLPEEQRTPYLLIADEFQRFLKLPTLFGDMTGEARKFRLGLVLANQLLDQIRDIRSDVLANTRSKLALETVAADAAMIAREIGVTENDIKRLGRFQAVLSRHRQRTRPPGDRYTLPPPPPVGLGIAVTAAARSTYGNPMAGGEKRYATAGPSAVAVARRQLANRIGTSHEERATGLGGESGQPPCRSRLLPTGAWRAATPERRRTLAVGGAGGRHHPRRPHLQPERQRKPRTGNRRPAQLVGRR